MTEEENIHILVLSAENEFQIKMINQNLEAITKQIQELNETITELSTIANNLEMIKKDFDEYVFNEINFKS